MAASTSTQDSFDSAQKLPTHDEKRREQLTTAPAATEDDAAARIVVSEGTDGATRIDIADDAPVRPGDPTSD